MWQILPIECFPWRFSSTSESENTFGVYFKKGKDESKKKYFTPSVSAGEIQLCFEFFI